MTKEEILQEFSDINQAYNNCMKYDTLKRMLDELTESKTGRWTEDFICSNCGCKCYPFDIDFGDYNYCPNCRAKMKMEVIS